MLDGYQTDAYLQRLTQANKNKREIINTPKMSETINTPIMTGWICPVCGRGLSPYTSVCPCKNRLNGWEIMC